MTFFVECCGNVIVEGVDEAQLLSYPLTDRKEERGQFSYYGKCPCNKE